MYDLRMLLVVLFLAGATPSAAARDKADDPYILTSAAFLAHHPDIQWRAEGMRAWEARRYKDALGYFRRAARFADKPSQAMLAEMAWAGQGGAADRALAYAWMDLAAEREYPAFASRREHLWSLLSAQERAAALEAGRRLYAEFGDDVAKPRLERVIARAARRVVGSRTGFVGNVMIRIPTAGGWMSISGDTFFDDRFWSPEAYWEWQDSTWRPVRTGRGAAGDLRPVDEGSDDLPQEEKPEGGGE